MGRSIRKAFASDTSWSELIVNGNADLCGNRNLFADAGFDPALGTTFHIFSATTPQHAFDTFQTASFDGKTFQLDQGANGYDMEVVIDPTPEPAAFPLMALTRAGRIAVLRRRHARLTDLIVAGDCRG